MARMLYLRDIEVDVLVRCRACGHEGVLPRADMNRRFGPNYPVLSIAPHYRCSRCNSRDTESRPAPPPYATPMPAMAAEEEAPSFAGPLAALQGLLDAVRTRGEPEEAPPPVPEPAPAAARAESSALELELERLIADTGSAPESGRRPLWEPVSLADLAGHDGEGAGDWDTDDKDWDDEQGTDDEPDRVGDIAPPPTPVTQVSRPAVEDDPDEDPSRSFDRTIAALRSILDGRGDSARAEEPPPSPFPPPPAFSIEDAGNDPEGDDPDDVDDAEPSTDDILAFAIRDPDKAPPPWERDPAPTDSEPLDRTIAALRSMVQKAAADRDEDGDEDGDGNGRLGGGIPDDEDDDRTGGVVTPLFGRSQKPVIDTDADTDADTDEAFRDRDEAEEEEGTEEEGTSVIPKSAQEQDMEEALRALRALVEAESDLDDPPPPAWRGETASRTDPEAEPDSLPGFKPLPRRTPEPDGIDEPLDLVEMLPVDEPENPKPGEDKGTETRESAKKAAKDESSALGKTIAALRNMLELDGKQGR